MTKFNNHFIYLLLLIVTLGCGITPISLANATEIFNGNSVTQITSEFKLIKIQSPSDFDRLPKELSSYKTQLDQFDFYLAQSPTQSSGGFFFESIQKTNQLVICLKKPPPLSAVTAALTNPIAVIRVRKGLSVEMRISYCHP
jgi:hypothetical protein